MIKSASRTYDGLDGKDKLQFDLEPTVAAVTIEFEDGRSISIPKGIVEGCLQITKRGILPGTLFTENNTSETEVSLNISCKALPDTPITEDLISAGLLKLREQS